MLMRCLGFLLSFLLLFLNCFSHGYCANRQRVVAIVNNEIITSLDLERRVYFIIKFGNLPNYDGFIRNLSKQILNLMIEEKLIEEDAKRLGITISQSDIDKAIEKLALQMNVPRLKLPEMFKSEGMNFQAYKDNVKIQLIWHNIQGQLSAHVSVSEEEVKGARLAYERIKAQAASFANTKVKLAEIVIYVNDNEKTAENALNILTEISQQKDSSKNFANLARSLSQSSSSREDGVIGWIRIGDLAPEIRSAIQYIEPGQISSPIILEESVMILKVIDKQAPRNVSASQIDNTKIDSEIRYMLMNRKAELYARNYISKLKQKALIEIKQ